MREASNADQAAWARLGRLLEQRRVLMRPSWRNLSAFARDRDIDYRLAWDVENARRTNFRRSTRAAIESAYGWAPGSIDVVLEGGDPVSTDTQRADEGDPLPEALSDIVSPEEWRNRRVQALWALEEIPAGTRRGLILFYLRGLENTREADVRPLRRVRSGT